MRVDRNAAAIVGDGEKAVGRKLDLDPIGMAGERLVHGIVDDLGEQVMQRLLVGAADIHAGPPPHRFEAFEDLDVLGRIAGLTRAARRRAVAAGSRASRLGKAGEQVAVCLFSAISRSFPRRSLSGARPWRAQWRANQPDRASDYATGTAKP